MRHRYSERITAGRCVEPAHRGCAGWRGHRVSRSVFFFQAEDGIRDLTVTGVQTCALPIYPLGEGPDQRIGGADVRRRRERGERADEIPALHFKIERKATASSISWSVSKIGRASCRERV